MRWPFSRKSASIETPQPAPAEAKSGTSVPADWLLELFGAGVASAGPVSTATALTVPAVSAAVRAISEAAMTLEVKVKRNGQDAPNHPVGTLLAGDCNDWLSSAELIRDLIAEALTEDAGGFAYVNKAGGRPVEILKYQRGAMSVQYATTGEPTFRLDGAEIPSDRVIHVRGPFDKCPLSLAKTAISAAWAMERHAHQLFATGARPGGVLETPKPIGDKGVAAMIAGWRAAHDGTGNAGKTAVLWDGTTFRPLTLNSTDSQFLENRRFQVLEIARAFRVPPTVIYDLERGTWSNSEQMGREFLVFSLEPWLKSLEGSLRRALFSQEERDAGYTVRFDRDDLTRADIGARATAYSSLIASRIYSPNEIRAWEGADPYAGGEQFANPNTGSNQPGAAAPQEAANADA